MTEWQPIETAPKDGTLILHYWPAGLPSAKPERYDVLRWSKSCKAWMSSDDTESTYLHPGTHWMLLPDPPA